MRAVGKAFSPAERQAFIVAARSYLGTRFRHMGRGARGLDCAGLVIVSLAAIGRPFNDAEAYGREPKAQGLRAALFDNLGPPVLGLREGDVVLMSFRGEPSHVGIVTGYPDGGFALLHTFAQAKRVVEHRMDQKWLGYIAEVFRP